MTDGQSELNPIDSWWEAAREGDAEAVRRWKKSDEGKAWRDEAIAEYFAKLPPGDDGLVEAYWAAYEAKSKRLPPKIGWATRAEKIAAGIAAALDLQRRRDEEAGWLSPSDAAGLRAHVEDRGLITERLREDLDDLRRKAETLRLQNVSQQDTLDFTIAELDGAKEEIAELQSYKDYRLASLTIRKHLETILGDDCWYGGTTICGAVAKVVDLFRQHDGKLEAAATKPAHTDEDIAKERRQFLQKDSVFWTSLDGLGSALRQSEIDSIAHIRPMFAACQKLMVSGVEIPTTGGWSDDKSADGKTPGQICREAIWSFDKRWGLLTEDQRAKWERVARLAGGAAVAERDATIAGLRKQLAERPQYVTVVDREREARDAATIAELTAKLTSYEAEMNEWIKNEKDESEQIAELKAKLRDADAGVFNGWQRTPERAKPKTGKLIYLASPYSDNNIDVRYRRGLAATRVMRELIRAGRVVFSPIADSHYSASFGVRPWNDPWWYTWSMAFLSRADECWVLMVDGWENSVGVENEMLYAAGHGIYIRYVDPSTLEVRDEP